MAGLLQIFTPKQWAMIVAATINAVAILWLLWHYFNSRWWIQAVTDKDGRVVAGDVQKAGAFALACVLIIAITVAKLGYQRDAGAEVVSFVAMLLTYSGALQDVKRRGLRDVLEAAKPNAPGVAVDAKGSTVGIGPNGVSQPNSTE